MITLKRDTVNTLSEYGPDVEIQLNVLVNTCVAVKLHPGNED